MTQAPPASAPAAGHSSAGGSPLGRRRIVLLIGAVVAIVAVTFGGATILGGPSRQVETGIVVEVQATSLIEVEGFSIRTGDGRMLDFRITTLENAATFPPGHLSEHRVSLAPVRVTFVDDSGGQRAVRIEDAP